jgi:succinate dehydrogenase / fumarate reductase flavoprotein subunit
MQDLVGIVRTDAEMREALTKLETLNARAARAGVDGHREFHTGWHAALDLRNLLAVSEAITRSALERRESRGGHFRDDFPDKSAEFATFNIAVRQHGGTMAVERRPIPEMPGELKQVIESQKQ